MRKNGRGFSVRNNDISGGLQLGGSTAGEGVLPLQ